MVQRQNKVAKKRDLTRWRAASLSSSSAVRDAENEEVSLSRIK